MSKIFISYRRADGAAAARIMHDRFTNAFGDNHIFMDVDKISPGQRFERVIQETLDKCSVLVCVIGPRWLEILNERAGDPVDFVLKEITVAIDRGIDVIPVILDGAELPSAQQLPVAIASLSQHQRAIVRHEFFNRDVDLLIDRIKDRHGLGGRRRWIRGLRSLGAISAAFALLFGSTVAYFEYQRTQEEERARAQSEEYERLQAERERERRDENRARFEAAVEAWSPKLRIRDNPQGPKHWMAVFVDSAPQGTSIRTDISGVNFKMNGGQQTEYFEPTRAMKLLVELIGEEENVLRSKDLTEVFWEATKRLVMNKISRYPEQLPRNLYCDIFGCSIAEGTWNATCHPFVAEARLIVGDKTISFDRSECATDVRAHVCLSAHQI